MYVAGGEGGDGGEGGGKCKPAYKSSHNKLVAGERGERLHMLHIHVVYSCCIFMCTSCLLSQLVHFSVVDVVFIPILWFWLAVNVNPSDRYGTSRCGTARRESVESARYVSAWCRKLLYKCSNMG